LIFPFSLSSISPPPSPLAFFRRCHLSPKLFCDVELFHFTEGERKKMKNKIRKIESSDIVTQQQQGDVEGEKMFVATMKTFSRKKNSVIT
jgi:hypothetical protein